MRFHIESVLNTTAWGFGYLELQTYYISQQITDDLVEVTLKTKIYKKKILVYIGSVFLAVYVWFTKKITQCSLHITVAS